MSSEQLVGRKLRLSRLTDEFWMGFIRASLRFPGGSRPANTETYRRMEKVRNATAIRPLPLETVHEVVRRMHTLKVKAGQVIIEQGETNADAFYLIASGRAEVWQTGLYDDTPEKVVELQPGDSFGEEALVTEGARSATVKIKDGGELFALNKDDFKRLISGALVREVDPESARDLHRQGYILLDVRYGEEHEEIRIPGSTLLPLHMLRQRVSELDASASYIAYCHSGKRSAVAALLLKQRNIDAVSLAGGIRDWPFEKES